jgi:hypothetical protein
MKPFTVQEAAKYKQEADKRKFKLAPNRAAGIEFERIVGHLLLGALGMCVPLGFLAALLWVIKTLWSIV